MSKKVLGIFLCITLLSVLITGCNGKSDNTTSESMSEETASKDTTTNESTAKTNDDNKKDTGVLAIANIPKMIGISWWDRMDVGNKEWSKATGNEVFQLGATVADAAEQISSIEDAIAQGVDAMTVIPVDPDSLEPVLEKAMNQDIVVISHEAANIQNVDYDIEAFNNEDYGAHLMDNLAAEMGEEGGYCIMVGSLTMASHQEWAAGAIKCQEEKYPNMYQVTEMVAPQATSTDASYQTAKELLASYTDLQYPFQ